jgi:bacterioferritin
MADQTLLRSHGLKTNIGKLIRRDTLDGRPHLVAPVVLITEGVHNNVYYSADELSKHTAAWNGRPLVAPNHPTVNGRPVTASSKRVLEKMCVGTVLNVNWDAVGKKLKGEAWFDEAKTKAKCPKVLEELKKNAPQIDVSTGLFTDDTMKTNVFGRKQYSCEAKNHRPDHLAVLPGGKGACSWEDGAGLPRINGAMDDDEIDEPVAEEPVVNAKQTPESVFNALLASEYRAWFTYYVSAQLVEGKSRTVIADEYEAHAEEELEHASALIQRMQELDISVTTNLKSIAELAGADEALPTDVEASLKLNAGLEEQAASDYQDAIDFFEDAGDDATVLLLTENMSAENGHLHDLKQLATDAGVKVNEDEGGNTCPDCGGELDEDGTCPECDDEEEDAVPVKAGAKHNSIMKTLSAICGKLGIALHTNKKTSISLNEKQNRVSKALRDRYAPPVSKSGGEWGNSVSPCAPSPWVYDLFDDSVVFGYEGKAFKLGLSWDNGNPTLEGEPVEVVQNTEWLPKNNSADKWVETDGIWGADEWTPGEGASI